MEHLDYFKLQAKNLFKDYKTRFFNEESKRYEYKPKYFDIGRIFVDFDFPDYKDDFTFTLMNAQHLIAKIVGIQNWNHLIELSKQELFTARSFLAISSYRLSSEKEKTENIADMIDWKRNVLKELGEKRYIQNDRIRCPMSILIETVSGRPVSRTEQSIKASFCDRCAWGCEAEKDESVYCLGNTLVPLPDDIPMIFNFILVNQKKIMNSAEFKEYFINFKKQLAEATYN